MHNVKHGHARDDFKTKTYQVWADMRNRCFNDRNKRYKDYGGRGIGVCPRWSEYTNFLLDMGECPQGLALDRIDNDGNYEPGNCRWATAKEQSRNRRTNNWIEYEGKRMIVYDWAKHLGIRVLTLRARLRRGWSIERAFNKPVQLRRIA